MASLAEIRQERLYRRWKNDEKAFLREAVQIEHPTTGTQPFELFSYQEETLDAIRENRRVLVLKARQIGYTTIVSGHILWKSIFHPHHSSITLSRREEDAKQIVRKVKHGWSYLPDWLKQRLPRIVKDNQTELAWANGSSVEAMPSQDDPARGRTASLIVLDEWAFYNNPEAAWASAMPVADVGGSIIALSTANGSGNLFHTQWIKATTGSSSFVPLFYPWWARAERDEAWYERQRKDLLEWQLHQEFPSNPEEAFIKSGNAVFDTDALRRIETVAPVRGYLKSRGPEKSAEFVRSAEGELRVWHEPERGHRYVVGADVAEGLEHGDYSVAHVIDTKTMGLVAKWRGHVAPDLFGSEVLWRLGWWYGQALVGVESNNHGLTTLVALRDKGYANLYYRTSYDERTNQRQRKMGWRTQVNTKPLLVDELAKAVRFQEKPEDAEVRFADAETIAELMTFVREADGKMHGSPFDDQVIAFGIAVQMLKHAFTPEYLQAADVERTLDWWVAMADADAAADEDVYTVGNLSVRNALASR